MFNKFITVILLASVAVAEVTFDYEGYCFGKEIPRNYYSLITRERKAEIQKEKPYAVVRVTNKEGGDVYICEMKLNIKEKEKKKEDMVYGRYYHYCKTTGHHLVKASESYRIFVPIPESAYCSSGKIVAEVSRQRNEENINEVICIEKPLEQRCKLMLSMPRYEGLESSITRTTDNQYELRLQAVGTAPTYFMYHKLLEIPVAIVSSNQGKNNRKVGWFGYDEFCKEYVVKSVLLPGDRIIATAHVFTQGIWLEGDDAVIENSEAKSILVRCEDVDVIAQDYGMFGCDEIKEESLSIDLELEKQIEEEGFKNIVDK